MSGKISTRPSTHTAICAAWSSTSSYNCSQLSSALYSRFAKSE
jgi:hypothetical protein